VVEWRPRSIEIEADIKAPSAIAVRQFRYPGWTLSMSPPNRTGMLAEAKPYLLVEVPSGRHTIKLVLAETTEEWAGRIASGVASALVAALLGIGLLRRGREGA